MNAMLSDEDLERLLTEAGGSFAVPEPGFEAPVVTKQVWQKRWPQASAAAAVLVVGGLLLSGGGGGLPSVAGSNKDFVGRLSPGATQHGTGGTTGGGALAPTDVGVVGTGSSTSSGDGADSARVVKTGSISLVVDEGKVSATVQRLQALVAAARGYVADSQSEEAGDHPSATLTVRVPAASFQTVVDQVRALKAARARYLTILSGARTIAETLTVQQRVDEVQQQIDQLEGQRRVLADQSDFGTLTLTVAETADEVFATEAPSGWSKAWDDAQHGFTSGVQGLIRHSGRTLLVLLVGAGLLLLGRTGWRLARRRLV